MKIKEENMKSFKEFVEEFAQAGPDPEQYNKVLTERSQEFVDEIRKCTGNIAQGDIPFAIIALTAAKAALEKISDDETKRITRYLMGRTKMLCIHNEYIKTK